MVRLGKYIFIEEKEMTEQVHKRLIDEQVKMILDRFMKKELQSEQAMGLLGLKRSQFFEWVKKYRESKEAFTIQYHREGKAREIHPKVESKILQELKVEKGLIEIHSRSSRDLTLRSSSGCSASMSPWLMAFCTS